MKQYKLCLYLTKFTNVCKDVDLLFQTLLAALTLLAYTSAAPAPEPTPGPEDEYSQHDVSDYQEHHDYPESDYFFSQPQYIPIVVPKVSCFSDCSVSSAKTSPLTFDVQQYSILFKFLETQRLLFLSFET